MATTDLECFTKGEERFGENVARTQRILAKLLLEWTKGKDSIVRDGKAEEQQRTHLRAIYFDKLCEFFCRLWNELHSRDKVRYPTCFTKRRGFHGPGRALQIDRTSDVEVGIDQDDHRHNKWAYTTEIVEKLNPALGRARNLFVVAGDSWKHTCKISPGIDESQWEAWLADDESDAETTFLCPAEVKYVETISKLITALTDDELRVLGTHFSSQETVEDILFNLHSWEKGFDDAISILRGEHFDYFGKPIDGNRSLYRLVTTAREVKRKTGENRDRYTAALQMALKSCDSPDVQSVIKYIQKPAASLWDDPTVQRYSNVAQPILDFSVYTRRGLNELGLIASLNHRELEESSDAYNRVLNPMSNITFELQRYDAIESKDDLLYRLTGCKVTLFNLLPPIRDLTEYGVPT